MATSHFFIEFITSVVSSASVYTVGDDMVSPSFRNRFFSPIRACASFDISDYRLFNQINLSRDTWIFIGVSPSGLMVQKKCCPGIAPSLSRLDSLIMAEMVCYPNFLIPALAPIWVNITYVVIVIQAVTSCFCCFSSFINNCWCTDYPWDFPSKEKLSLFTPVPDFSSEVCHYQLWFHNWSLIQKQFSLCLNLYRYLHNRCFIYP